MALGAVTSDLGKNADKVICTWAWGVATLMETIMQMTAKRAEVVVTNIHPLAMTAIPSPHLA